MQRTMCAAQWAPHDAPCTSHSAGMKKKVYIQLEVQPTGLSQEGATAWFLVGPHLPWRSWSAFPGSGDSTKETRGPVLASLLCR
jgi:hypothetical protein